MGSNPPMTALLLQEPKTVGKYEKILLEIQRPIVLSEYVPEKVIVFHR